MEISELLQIIKDESIKPDLNVRLYLGRRWKFLPKYTRLDIWSLGNLDISDHVKKISPSIDPRTQMFAPFYIGTDGNFYFVGEEYVWAGLIGFMETQGYRADDDFLTRANSKIQNLMQSYLSRMKLKEMEIKKESK